jgi:hypothetical protein
LPKGAKVPHILPQTDDLTGVATGAFWYSISDRTYSLERSRQIHK